MPTGYTAAVQDGTITELAPFAMRCARAFGATVLMRDEPDDAKIPQAFEPNQFYLRREQGAVKRLAELRRFSPLDAQRAMQQEHSAAIARWKDRRAEMARHRVRYQTMLDQVNAWTSPGEDHRKFKLFMRDQLTESLRFDCDNESEPAPRLARWPDWLQANIHRAHRDILQSQQEYAKEVARAESRTAWVTDLRISLGLECVNYILADA